MFEFLFAISFILNGYATGLNGISIGSLVFVVMIIFALIHNQFHYFRKANAVYLCYFCWLIVSIFGMLQLADPYLSVSSVLVGNLKVLTWVLMITVVAAEFFDLDKLIKWMVRISVVLTIYIIIQTVAFYVFAVYLPNIFSIGPIQPYAEGYANYEAFSGNSMLRPGSLLSEPAFYGNYVLCTLAMYLEKYFDKMGKKRWVIVLFLSLGIIVSTSTAAIVLLGLVWVIYLYKIKVNKVWIALLGVALVVVFAVSSGVLHITSRGGLLNALKYAFDKFEYLDSSARVGKSYHYLSMLNLPQKLFGVGIGNDLHYLASITNTTSEVYVNSITSIIVQMGYIGLAVFVTFIVYLYYKILKQKDTLAFVLLSIYCIKGFVSGIYFSTYGILFMFVIMGSLCVKKGIINAE